MRLLVTGGAGFIGSAVIRECLRKTDHQILNVDKLTYAANLRNLEAVLPNPNYSFARADICDGGEIARLLKRFDPDAIMHLAAESHVDRSIAGAGAFIATNIVGTYVLLDAALTHYDALPAARRRRFRFHHVSTDEVYGSLGPEGKFTEKTPYAPNSPYSASKASSDMLVRAWHRTYGLPVITSNSSNNYGPYQFPEKLLPVVILNGLSGRRIPVYGHGQNVRDWLHVEDHARALLRILEQGVPGETYGVGGNCERRNIDLVRMICGILDTVQPDPAGPHERLIEYVTDRPGHDARYAIDASRIERELNWRPQIALEKGMADTVAWYRDNAAWWGNICDRSFKWDPIGPVR